MVTAHLHPTVRIRPQTVLTATLLVGSAAVLAVQLRDVSFGDLFAHVRVGWLCLAFAAFAVSLGAAAHNISAFAPLRLRALDTLRAQLAVGALRIVAPAAVSTPAIGARFLTRSGLAVSESLAVVATAQTAQLLMTVVVVSTIAGLGSAALPLPDGRSAALVGVAVAVGLGTAVLVGRRCGPVRRVVGRARDALRTVVTHLRERPVRVVTGLAASGALTLAHVAAFTCCVHAVGGDASLLALTAVYLGASGAGSLVPTPAGIGAVEATLISGLAATGMPVATATAAALLTRLVTVWVPALPGWWAMRSLRRAALL
jgi:glycosyltransferase 2 family protein